MDEEKAIKTLTSKIVDDFGSQIVRDESYKNKLIKNAEYFCQFGNPFIIGFDKHRMSANKENNSVSHTAWVFVNSERTRKNDTQLLVYASLEKAIDDEGDHKSANYFFIDKPITNTPGFNENSRGMSFFVTPCSIIGKKEVNNLRNIFYKDVHPEVLSAMNVLGIDNYVELYELYSDNNTDFKTFLDNYFFYLKINDAAHHLFNIKSRCPRDKFAEYFGCGIKDLNKDLMNRGFNKKLASLDPDIYKRSVEEVIDYFKYNTPINKFEGILQGFLNFVFTIPYEDQSLDINEEILKSFKSLDYMDVFLKEYSEGKYFEKYFSCLDKKRRKRVINSLKSVSRNPILDSFLWKEGFRDLDVDYLELYKSNAEDFIKYYKEKDHEAQKIILSDIMDCGFINKDVVDWLNENEELHMREVGLNG